MLCHKSIKQNLELPKYTKFNHFVNLIWFNLIFENLVYFDNHQEVSSLLRSFVQIYISVFAILSLKSKVSFKIRNLFSSINGVIYDVLRTWFVSCMICMSNLPFLFYKFIPSFLWLAAFYRWSAFHTNYSHELFPTCSKCIWVQSTNNGDKINV